MLTIAETIYPDDYHRLKAIIAALEERNVEQAHLLLATADQGLSTIHAQPQRLQMELFIKALQSRLNHAQAENLYLVPDEGQQIRMFNFMAEKFPVVRYAQSVANSIFLDRLARETTFTILDIGIGTGQQMAGLVQQIAHQAPQVREISILGIEPSAESLCKAEARLEELATEHGISLSFTAFQKTVEQLDAADWALLAKSVREPQAAFMINASFALHHVQPIEFRTALFSRLKALDPSVFVIIEPYADYTPEDSLIRFRNAWHHYGLTFRAIDTIDAAEDEKSAVKRVFFGREMIDVLSEGNRVEQFETAEMWAQRLQQAGFTISPVQNVIAEDFNPVIKIALTPSYLGLDVSGHPIVAVICAS